MTKDGFVTGMRRLSWFAVPVTMFVSAVIGAFSYLYNEGGPLDEVIIVGGLFIGLVVGLPTGFVVFGLVRMAIWVGKGFLSGPGTEGN